MTPAQKIELELSKTRSRLNEIAGIQEITPEIREEAARLEVSYSDLELRHRASIIGQPSPETRETTTDPEMRERIELRGKASLTSFLRSAIAGRLPSGAEAELMSAAGISEGIPLELWDTPRPIEERAVADLPGTVGINLDRIRPAVFANAVLPRLGVEMPRVESGTYASATISTSQSATAQAKGGAAVGVAGAMSVTTATPKRISGRLEIAIEDIAAVGQQNFESALRENLSLVLSDALDNAGLNGDGQAPNLTGLFTRLTDPTAAPTAVADFDRFAGSHAGGVDGLWAETIKDVAIVVGPATYRLAAGTFQTATNYKGEMSAAAYAMMNSGGFWTSKRMPDAATFLTVDDVQQAVLYRMGRSMMGGMPGMRTAVCPHWNVISIDDIYSLSASGQRAFTMHVILGDVIIVQPDAYAQIAYKVA